MSVTRVGNRGEKFDDSGCASKWKWEWVSVELEVKNFEEVKKEHISTQFWKVDVVVVCSMVHCLQQRCVIKMMPAMVLQP